MNNPNFENSHIIIDEILKKSELETTEKVYLIDGSGNRFGPYIRKVINSVELGSIYQTLCEKIKSSTYCQHLPQIYLYRTKSNKTEIIEEYIQGLSLSEYVSSAEFKLEKVYRIIAQLCQATNYLHKNFDVPIIHRDIKPQNIIVEENTELKLIDFGIARKYDAKNSSDTKQFGTIGYAPPEQFGFQQTDEKSDVYSIGKVMEFVLNPSNWRTSKLTIIDPLFIETIDIATSFDPDNRYKSISELYNAFNSAYHGGDWLTRISKNKAIIVFGHIWNSILAMLTIFMCYITISMCIDNQHDYVGNSSIGARAIFIFMFIFCIFLPIWLVFSYKPSIRTIYKKLPKIKFQHYFFFVLLCLAAILILAFSLRLFESM